MKKDPFLEALKKTVAVCYMIHAAIFALAAFLTAPGGHGIVGLVNWGPSWPLRPSMAPWGPSCGYT